MNRIFFDDRSKGRPDEPADTSFPVPDRPIAVVLRRILRDHVRPRWKLVALTALELLVAFLEAYVFTILTCLYLNDAIHPGH